MITPTGQGAYTPNMRVADAARISRGVHEGWQFMENLMGTPLIPNWNSVTSANPGILDMLKKAVEEENKS